MTKHFTT